METKKRFRILNYPQTIDGCHDLIRLLVDELNEQTTTDNSIVSNNNSIPLANDNRVRGGTYGTTL